VVLPLVCPLLVEVGAQKNAGLYFYLLFEVLDYLLHTDNR